MLGNALIYHEQGWLKALLVYARGSSGWAMEEGRHQALLTAQGLAYTAFADAEQAPKWSQSFGEAGKGNGQFTNPFGVAVNSNGDIWVGDYEDNRFEEFSPQGKYLAQFGEKGTGNGQFEGSKGIAINQSSGDIYVSDTVNGRIEEFSSQGKYLAQFGEKGSGKGQLKGPMGLAIDANGDVWVADSKNDRVQGFSAEGKNLERSFGEAGKGNGQFEEPHDLAISGGNFYVLDYGNRRIEEFSPQGKYLGQFGSEGKEAGQFMKPSGIAADPINGDLYVVDEGANRIDKFNPQGTFLTSFSSGGSGKEQVNAPRRVALNAAGAIYVADWANDRVQEWTSLAPSWNPEKVLDPGKESSYLQGVSCVTSCTAVGSSDSGSASPLAESWNGREWSQQSTPSPSGALGSWLTGVSCISARICTAVGADTSSSGTEVTLAEGWEGMAWKLHSPPNPSGAKASSLAGVSCVRPSICEAVGTNTNGSGVREPLAQEWSGTQWKLQTAAIPKGVKASGLDAVSCVSAATCVAVGSSTSSAGTVASLAEEWNGKGWSIQTTPSPAGASSSELSSVACVSASICTAVGRYEVSGKEVPLAERWSGGEWSIQGIPLELEALGGHLAGVSCTSADSCQALGDYGTLLSSSVPLAEVWNGTWSIETAPTPGEATGAIAYGVSCVWATGCTTVGWSSGAKGATQTLAEGYSQQ